MQKIVFILWISGLLLIGIFALASEGGLDGSFVCNIPGKYTSLYIFEKIGAKKYLVHLASNSPDSGGVMQVVGHEEGDRLVIHAPTGMKLYFEYVKKYDAVSVSDGLCYRK